MSDGRSSGGYIVKKQSSKKEEDIPSLNDTHTKEPIKTGKEARTNSLPDQYQQEGHWTFRMSKAVHCTDVTL